MRLSLMQIQAWLRANLFSSVGNSVATLLALAIIMKALAVAVDWALLSAVFTGDDGRACAGPGVGACWPFITHKLRQFGFGRYPEAERWRVIAVYALVIAGVIAATIPQIRAQGWAMLALAVVIPIACFVLLVGGRLGLVSVPTDLWGGLLVTLVVASVGITASLPLGVLLALGRRSNLPLVRWLSIGFIEIVRGVPLITVLFMASVMLPLVLPPGVSFDKLLRALIGVALFASAYMAEVVRGGLQAIPKGQFQAADAMGLTGIQKMRYIVLPQALRISIPGIVNSYISLFKDTSLVLIIGLFDLLGAVEQAITSDSKWFSPATALTGYVFAGCVFWVFCFTMSRIAAGLEARLSVGRER
jgi:general L-amino acid transport system permease protein